MIKEDFEGMLYTPSLKDPFSMNQSSFNAFHQVRCLTTNTYNGNISKELVLTDYSSKEKYSKNQWVLESIKLYYNWYDLGVTHIEVTDPMGNKATFNLSDFNKEIIKRPVKVDFCVTTGYRVCEAIEGFDILSQNSSIEELKEQGYKTK
ncbi:MAG: hypothetical protein J1D77_05430 [Muribaculaceae bacterium]|nr:hypothetical protein [Muribaculaceae bacterium]